VTAGAGRRRHPEPAHGLLGSEGGISGGGGSSGRRCWCRPPDRLCDFASIVRNSASACTKYTVRTSHSNTTDAFSCECSIHVPVLASTALQLAVPKRASHTTRGTHPLAYF